MTHDLAVQLRLATADDAPIIRALTRQAYQPWVAVIGREPLPMTADYELACASIASTSPIATAR